MASDTSKHETFQLRLYIVSPAHSVVGLGLHACVRACVACFAGQLAAIARQPAVCGYILMDGELK